MRIYKNTIFSAGIITLVLAFAACGGMDQIDEYAEDSVICLDLTQSCEVLKFEHTYYCDDYANEDYSCPEGYTQTDEDTRCTGTAILTCKKCEVTNGEGSVVLQDEEAVFFNEDDELCQSSEE